MGEISEMMLDGTLCIECGAYIEDYNADGYPRECEDCKRERKRKKKNIKMQEVER